MSNAPHGDETARARGVTASTIYDVARAARVIASTVSRALSNPGRVKATEQRIRAAAEELHYRANLMPTGRTRTVGLVLGDLTNPAFLEIVRGTERAAAEADYMLIVSESEESTAGETTGVDRVLAAVDGLVLATRVDTDEAGKYPYGNRLPALQPSRRRYRPRLVMTMSMARQSWPAFAVAGDARHHTPGKR